MKKGDNQAINGGQCFKDYWKISSSSGCFEEKNPKLKDKNINFEEHKPVKSSSS